MNDTIDTIRVDHKNFWRVLEAMSNTVEQLGDTPSQRELNIIRSALYYMRVYPDRHHHPKEERHLFTALRKVHPSCAPLLSEIEAEHELGESMLQQLDDLLERYERGAVEVKPELQALVSSYVTQQSQHMRREETELLPLADQFLTATQRARIDAEFHADNDPLFQGTIDRGFEVLADRLEKMAGERAR